MNIGIVIQARMGSTRLPGKILKQFYGGKTLLETLLDNLHKVVGAKVIVATSVNENNDQLETFLLEKGELVYRGSENDVLDRFIKAAEANGVDGIVRICSDNPFMDWHGVAALVEKAQQSDADYIGFRINDARSLMQYPVVFAGIIAIAVVGVIMDLAISLIGKLCTPWEKGR